VRLPLPPTAVAWRASRWYGTLAAGSDRGRTRRGARCRPVDNHGGACRGTNLAGAMRDSNPDMRAKISPNGGRHGPAQRQLFQFGTQSAKAKRHSLRRRGRPRQLGAPATTQMYGRPGKVHSDLPKHACKGEVGQARAECLRRRCQQRHSRRRAEAVDVDDGASDHVHGVWYQPPQTMRTGVPRHACNVQRRQSKP